MPPGSAAGLPRLGDEDWLIIDCRFDLARPAWGAQRLRRRTHPRRALRHLDRELSGAAHRSEPAAIPCRDPVALAATFGRFGIDTRVQVVAYDQGTGAYAARLWWLLRWLGHERVAVLNGGLCGLGARRAAGGDASPARGRRAASSRARGAARDRHGGARCGARPRRPRARSPAADRRARRRPLRGRKRDHRRDRRPHPGRAQPPLRRQPRRARPIPAARGAAPRVDRDAARPAAGMR